MRAVVQRVSEASVSVAGQGVSVLPAAGLLVLVGVTHDDTGQTAAALASKIFLYLWSYPNLFTTEGGVAILEHVEIKTQFRLPTPLLKSADYRYLDVVIYFCLV